MKDRKGMNHLTRRDWLRISAFPLTTSLLTAANPASAQPSAATPPTGELARQTPALAALERAARTEGRIASIGMPDDWANWRGVWTALEKRYGLQHTDSDMSSAEQLAKMAAEGKNASADIGDVGFEFGPIAASRSLSAPYKPTTWDQIPGWAKDVEGHWALAYTGTIAMAVNTRRVSIPINGWASLLGSKARVCIGEVGRAAQANAAVLACAVGMGGDEARLDAALEAFARLRREGRLISVNPSPALMERGEADVFLLWDFNALSYRRKVPNAADYQVLIPAEGSVTSGYTTIINRHAPRPNAARLAREFIFSDEGQLLLARGHARPIRIENLTLPADLKDSLLPNAQYRNARPIRHEAWQISTKTLGQRWQRQVLSERG